jgi:hypothetical protein
LGFSNLERCINPIFLPQWEDHIIGASALVHEHNLAASAQTVDGEKHLIPREIGTLTRDIFEVAAVDPAHDVDHLIFLNRMLCHATTFRKRHALLLTPSCIADAKDDLDG